MVVTNEHIGRFLQNFILNKLYYKTVYTGSIATITNQQG